MDTKTLDFLKKEMPELYAYIAPENELETKEDVQKSDEILFSEELPSVTRQKVRLLYSLYCVERSSTRDKILDVSHAAADTDDFVTALYWHEKLSLAMPQDLSLKFERYFYSLLATEQKKKMPDAKPITSAQQLLCYRSETSRALKDPKYMEIEARYLEKKADTYRQRFLSDTFEHSALRSAQRKIALTTSDAFLLLLAGSQAALAFGKRFPLCGTG